MTSVDTRLHRMKAAARKSAKIPQGNKWVRRGLYGVAALAIWGTGHDSGVAEQVRTQPQAPSSVPVEQVQTVHHKIRPWQEDEWPSDLMLWAGCNLGPCDVHKAGTVEGHKYCMVGVNETSMIACPDGFRSYS